MIKMDAAKPFQLVAGHPALDLVNTLDNRFVETEAGPQELLTTYEELIRFLLESSLVTPERARKLNRMARNDASAQRVVRQVRMLREILSAIAYALVDGETVPLAEVAAFERFLRQAREHRALRVVRRDSLVWGWETEDEVATPLWLLAAQAEDLMLSEQTRQLRSCASHACRWLFLDTSKNHTRRWCDMKICGNRVKARKFQAALLAVAEK